MRTLVVIAIALSLAACESEAEKKAKWIAFCSSNDFTPKQCEVLWALAQNQTNRESAASAAGQATGLSIGIATGAGGK